MSHIEWLGPNKIRNYLGVNSYGIVFEEIYVTNKDDEFFFTKTIYAHNKYNTRKELVKTTYTLEEFSELASSINTILSISKNNQHPKKARILSFIISIKGLLEALENEVNKNE
jgi:hypothetical protein